MKKGDVYLFSLSDSLGHEQSGSRPGILVSDLANGMIIIVPLTSNMESLRFSNTLSILPSKKNNLKSESVALIFHLKSIDKRRTLKHLGKIDLPTQKNLNQILKDMLNF